MPATVRMCVCEGEYVLREGLHLIIRTSFGRSISCSTLLTIGWDFPIYILVCPIHIISCIILPVCSAFSACDFHPNHGMALVYHVDHVGFKWCGQGVLCWVQGQGGDGS